VSLEQPRDLSCPLSQLIMPNGQPLCNHHDVHSSSLNQQICHAHLGVVPHQSLHILGLEGATIDPIVMNQHHVVLRKYRTCSERERVQGAVGALGTSLSPLFPSSHVGVVGRGNGSEAESRLKSSCCLVVIGEQQQREQDRAVAPPAVVSIDSASHEAGLQCGMLGDALAINHVDSSNRDSAILCASNERSVDAQKGSSAHPGFSLSPQDPCRGNHWDLNDHGSDLQELLARCSSPLATEGFCKQCRVKEIRCSRALAHYAIATAELDPMAVFKVERAIHAAPISVGGSIERGTARRQPLDSLKPQSAATGRAGRVVCQCLRSDCESCQSRQHYPRKYSAL
jgi:hypothetical protein